MNSNPSSMNPESYTLFFDGCSKNNPGPAGAGAVLYKNGKEICSMSIFLGLQTNNYAEYTALIKGLEMCMRYSIATLQVKGDSKLVISQMNGDWKVSNAQLAILYQQAKQFEDQLNQVSYEYIPREQNKRADMLANQALLKGFDACNPLHNIEEYTDSI